MFKTSANGKTIYGSLFTTVEAAKRAKAHAVKPEWVVTNGATVLLVRPVDASRLEKVGYQIIG